MKKNIGTFFLLFITFFVASQESVFVKSEEIGNGVLCKRGGECYTITPWHVVEKTFGDIVLINEDKIKTNASLLGEYGSDLAILSTKTQVSLTCKEIAVSDFYFKALENVSSGVIEYLDESGVYNLIHVNITFKDNIGFTIIPQNGNASFAKGMSGSSFYFNYKEKKILAGMLMHIEQGFKEAFVMQIDDVLRVLSPFFEIKTPKKKLSTGPKKLGIMMLANNSLDKRISNELVIKLNQGNKYKAFSEFSESSYIKSVFDDIMLEREDIVIPVKLRQELDEIFIGHISFSNQSNRKKVYNFYANFKGGVYSTSNFRLLNSVNATGKGIGIDELNSKNQAVKSLINNIKDQFK